MGHGNKALLWVMGHGNEALLWVMGHGNEALSVYLEMEQDILYLFSLFILLKCIIFPSICQRWICK